MLTTDQSADSRLLEDIRRAVDANNIEHARDLADQMLEKDALALLQELSAPDLTKLFQVLGDSTLATLLVRLDDIDAASILERMPPALAADMLERITPDDATDIYTEIDKKDRAVAAAIMAEMDPAEAAEIQQLMAYDPHTAGGIMTPAFVAVYPDLRADQTVTAIRQLAAEAETVSYIYVIDREEKLLGVLSLHSLVLNPPETLVSDLMAKNTWSILVHEDQEVAARLLTERDLAALPVVDKDNRLLGIITHDDVADILEEEATEDIERLGGSQPLETSYRHSSVMHLLRKRVPWLLILFVTEAYTGTILRAFENELEQVIALAFFIPLLLDTGGNVGSQITTTLVRAMAVENLSLKDVRWIVNKEVLVSIAVAAIIAIIAFLRAQILHVGFDIAMVVAITIAAICVWSALVSSILPLVIRRLKLDPTVVSAPFITTLVDGTGLIIYFMVAKAVLNL